MPGRLPRGISTQEVDDGSRRGAIVHIAEHGPIKRRHSYDGNAAPACDADLLLQSRALHFNLLEGTGCRAGFPIEARVLPPERCVFRTGSYIFMRRLPYLTPLRPTARFTTRSEPPRSSNPQRLLAPLRCIAATRSSARYKSPLLPQALIAALQAMVLSCTTAPPSPHETPRHHVARGSDSAGTQLQAIPIIMKTKR